MKYHVEIKDYGKVEVEHGKTILEVIKEIYPNQYRKYLGAISDHKVVSLLEEVNEDLAIELLDITTVWGYRIYNKTVSAIFLMACDELFPGKKIRLEHFLGSGLYAELEKDIVIGHRMISEIEKKMEEIAKADIPIVKSHVSSDEIISYAKEKGYDETVDLFETADRDEDEIHCIGDFCDIFQGNLAPSTGFVRDFALKYYYPGVLIVFPSFKNNYNIENYREQPKLAKVFSEATEWADIMDLAYLGSLNRKVKQGKIREVIQVAEALQEKKLNDIADKIVNDKDIKLVLIAGPTSSGKTTFSKRLSIALKVNGLRPQTISMDDYFVNREDTPLDKDGNYDFETIEALDLELLNRHIVSLLEGDEVAIPKFNFKEGRRVDSGKTIKVDFGHPLIIEGIHGLNPKLSLDIPDKNKYKVYISALTQLNLDAHNRIPTTDTRLLRRLIRDNQFRALDPNKTFDMWHSVRAGEEKHIFPFQEYADIMFDSALVYEFSVLKKHAIPLLTQIEEASPHYLEATKLLRFLSYFLDVDDEDAVPNNSILREFIGNSTFDVH